MPKYSLISGLQGLFRQDSLPHVVAALRQDRLVWERLQDQAFFEKVSSRCGGYAHLWKPAALALIDLDEWPQNGSLPLDLGIPFAARKQQEAAALHDAVVHQGKIPANLAEAGLLALALRERRQLIHNWGGFTGDLHPGGIFSPIPWQTALACLYGLLPDGVEMLKALLDNHLSEEIVRVFNHILVSNQVEITHQVTIYTDLFGNQPIASQSLLVRTLTELGQRNLSSLLAQNFHKNDSTPDQKIPPFTILGLENAIHQALELQQRASLHYYAGQPDQSLPLLHKAEEAAHQWLDDLDAEIFAANSKTTIPNGAGQPVLQKTLSQPAPSRRLQNELALGQITPPEVQEFVTTIPVQSLSPLVQIQQAGWFFNQGNQAQARQMAAEAMRHLALLVGQEKGQPAALYGLDWHPLQVVRTLTQLDMPTEALHLALLALQVKPDDIEIVSECSRLLAGLDDPNQAVEYARLATALDPHNPSRRRMLASLLETTGDWENALFQRLKVQELDPQATVGDIICTGKVAARLKNWTAVFEHARHALEIDENEGQAYALLGQVFLNQGDLDESIKHFSRATLLIPEDPSPWLMLSDTYLKLDQRQRSLETLRAAALAVPESAEVNFNLAKACLEQGLASEALPFLKQAATLDPGSLEVGFELGKTLHELGYTAEAAQVFEETRKKWPQDPELAFAQAQTLLTLGKIDLALPALDAAVKAESPRFEWYSLHARTLLGDDSPILIEPNSIDPARLVNACQSLEKALALQPDSFIERLLLAETLAVKGDLEQALAVYKQIADLPPARTKEWRWRLQVGLGKTSLLLKKAPAALAALQEAVQARPEDKRLVHLVVEALILANLRQEAVQAARYALKLAPADIGNLSWFAAIMVRLNEEREALNALQCAAQLDPNAPSHWVELAGLQLKLGDLSAARSTLQKFQALKNISAEQYRQAAYTYLRLEDSTSALYCMERSLDLFSQPPASLLIEVACLYHRINDDEMALEILQKAIQTAPERAYLYVFQADLLSTLNRIQAALASLEQARRWLEADNPEQPADFELMAALMPQPWLASLLDLSALDARSAILLRQAGDFTAAIHHADNALKQQPSNGMYRYLASDLALALLQPEKARDLLKNLDNASRPFPNELLCLLTETALDQGEEIRAGQLAAECVTQAPFQARTLAIQTRLLALKGDWGEAIECFNQAYEAYQLLPPRTQNRAFGLQVNLMQESGLWLAESALAVHLYDQALELIDQYTVENINEPRARLALGRGLALCAERQRTFKLLKVERHAPGDDKLTDTYQTRFENTILAAGNLARGVEVNRWLARGRAAFKPIPQHVRPLVSLPPDPEDTAALIAVLRQINNPNGAIQMALRFPQNEAVQIQLALCLLNSEPLSALETAGKVAESHPSNPICQAVFAIACENAGDQFQSLEALERALHTWPDEAGWHAWAAGLAAQAGDFEAELSHLETAYALQPQSVDYAIALAQFYFVSREQSKAAQILEKAIAIDGQRADVWLLMAQVNRQDGQVEKALEYASKAADLDLASAAPIILSGEIMLKAGNTDEALEYATYALNRAPQDDQAILFLTHVLSQKGQPAEGLNVLENAIQSGHASLAVLMERTSLIRRIKGSQAALPILEDLAAQYPGDARVLSLLSQTQADCGDLSAAEISAAAALRLDSRIPGLNLFMGKLQRKSGQLDQAIHYLSANIQQNPGDVEAYLELGRTHQERREYLQAIKVYQQAIQYVPSDYRPYYEAALMMKESKDFVGAEAMLRRAAGLNPSNLNIRRQLAAVITLNLVHNAQEVESYK